MILNNDLTITSTNLPNTLTFATGNNARIVTGSNKIRVNSQSAVGGGDGRHRARRLSARRIDSRGRDDRP